MKRRKVVSERASPADLAWRGHSADVAMREGTVHVNHWVHRYPTGGSRTAVHFVMRSALPRLACAPLVADLGPPRLAVPPPALVMPGQTQPIRHVDWMYRSAGEGQLILQPDRESDLVKSIYVIWEVPA